MTAPSGAGTDGSWPDLTLSEWADTRDTLQLWTQVVGKVRLALMPMINHWWQVTLYVSGRGLTTGLMPAGGRGLEIEFDFVEHVLDLRTTDGHRRRVALEPRSVASFYAATMTALDELGVAVRVFPHPQEVADAIPFPEDEVHRTYDGDAAQRFWRALVQCHRVLLAYPEPEGFGDWSVPAGAHYDAGMGEFLLPYAAVRTAPDPDGLLLDFLQSTYEAAAELAGWDRVALEARP